MRRRRSGVAIVRGEALDIIGDIRPPLPCQNAVERTLDLVEALTEERLDNEGIAGRHPKPYQAALTGV